MPAASQVAAKAAKRPKAAPKSKVLKLAKPALLAGSNPQTAKADGIQEQGRAISTYTRATGSTKRSSPRG